jgi:electron transport complex protein RnfD
MEGRGRLVVSSSPHIVTDITTSTIMRDVIIALVPAAAAGVYFFGARALAVILISVLTAVVTEAALQNIMKKQVTVNDLSAAVAGLLFALVLPPAIPLWMPAIGSFLLIFLAKHLFGGLGHNPFNPAHIGRAILLASWPVAMTTWVWPLVEASWIEGFDALTSATPLALMKLEGIKTPYWNLFIGNVAGSIGETSAFALLIGAAYLLVRGHITLHAPLGFIGSAAVTAAILGHDPLFHILAGGLLIGAFFMATDYVTTPITPKGRIIFGIGCGVLTLFIRIYGGYPEGVCYAILLMNAATPVIDKYVRPRRFGEVKADA